MNDFIQLILGNLERNGFPSKKVSLPTEKMYESADNKGLNLNKVLEVLQEQHQIKADIQTERIVFFQETEEETKAPNQADLMQQAQEAMANMSPEQLQQMQQMFMNMSEEEKEEIMRKGKEMGLI